MEKGRTAKFYWKGNDFYLNDEPIQLFSGEMHYQRIPAEYWEHRLMMAKAMGLNSVAIYMFWNNHEPKSNEFNFECMNNVRQFVEIAQKIGLWVIIRPGPYCCAEWDFGGFPPWLLAKGDIRLRCYDETYIKAVERYMKRWAKELIDLQCTQGGPIIMIQIENEYGSYGSDKAYLAFVKKTLIEVGFEVPLFTCDGPGLDMLTRGTLPDKDVLVGINFGNRPEKNFECLGKFRKDIPHMCFEYYPGWFNHWGNKFAVSTNAVRIKQIASHLEWMITNNKSFNLYMFHGGTNFGFTAGANYSDSYKPDITSYDYSSPLDESGRPNDQFHAYRKLLGEHQHKGIQLINIPETPKCIEIKPIQFTESALLFDNLPEPINSPQIKSQEYYGQNYGLILYRKEDVLKPYSGRKMKIKELHDFGLLYMDGKKFAELNTTDRKNGYFEVKVPSIESKTAQLDILVEPHGRVNYGREILDRKGITEYVGIDHSTVFMGWKVYPIKCDTDYMNSLKFIKHKIVNNEVNNVKNEINNVNNGGIETQAYPVFHRGYFNLDETGDTFLDMRMYRKGLVWINGHNLGRFWELGPYFSLYLPGPWLKTGRNEIIILNILGPAKQRKIKKVFKIELKRKDSKKLAINYKYPPIKGVKSHVKRVLKVKK